MSVGQMSVGQMSVGQMSVSQMSVGQMSVGQMSFGQMSVSQMSVSQMSVSQMSVSQMSVGQMYFGPKLWNLLEFILNFIVRNVTARLSRNIEIHFFIFQPSSFQDFVFILTYRIPHFYGAAEKSRYVEMPREQNLIQIMTEVRETDSRSE